MHGRQVTKKDLALLMMDISPESSFDDAIKTVNEMLNQHPEGDTQRVRQLLEFEMLDALMESEVRSEEELLIESIVNLSRLGDDFPYETLPESLAEKAQARRSFEDDFAAESYAGDYMVQSDVARIMDSASRLTMMTPPDENYEEWWKSQLSVVADKIDGLADYLEDRYAEETDGMDAEMRYAPEFYVHSFDEYFGPYYSLEDAQEAVERLGRRGIVVIGITRGQEWMAETFEAPYAGKGSLFSLGQSDALSGLTAKELTESSAIHGDFDSASLNYSGKQNLEVRTAETRKANLPIPNPDMAQMYYRSLLE